MEGQNIILTMAPDLVLRVKLTLNGLNYPYLEEIFMVLKVYILLKSGCISNQQYLLLIRYILKHNKNITLLKLFLPHGPHEDTFLIISCVPVHSAMICHKMVLIIFFILTL